MVMRVLPSDVSTAPRLALEKSYAFFIDPDFLWFRLAHGDESCVVAAKRVDTDTELSEHVRSMEMNRCSPCDEKSSMVRARGSLSTPSPSARETPCFFRFAASASEVEAMNRRVRLTVRLGVQMEKLI